ncbi:hypothetical protein SAPIO_CDS7269 [Scedosporium apiospermum]|uniref:Protein HGH1 homolog n=1 Tax=Pseudallescheria apiosperma TaxID=563466 RepID=A0A084G1H5_PSEDA|nr:uncharacterized protein SAPIO_CDS7269 [Scedosporium apiospermum]KEZ41187.1 hypothetical protein SAPIO_CDS7269 [Scedosporium apiospermum]
MASKELQELVDFIAHPNPQVRLGAIEGAVPYSLSNPEIFKADDLRHIRNLMVLVRDHPRIAKSALTILVNLTGDRDVLESVATNEQFLSLILTLSYPFFKDASETNADLMAMLLANLSKWESIKDTLLKKQQKAPEALNSDDLVINQLLDLFVKGFDGSYNKDANFDYLAYFFADLAKHTDVQEHFIARQDYDKEIPLTKIKVFTEHKSHIRRKGVASTIKNAAFEVSSHPSFLSEDDVNILPYLLLPIAGNEEYDEDDMMDMLPDLQLLPPDKERDSDPEIILTHIETLTILTTTRPGRDLMRQVKVYPLIRETHLHVEHEGVKEACERLVNVLMRDEAPTVEEIEEDEENVIMEV